jgi:glycosyltransferase
MKVSVITVCYNSETYIIDTINSVNNQDYDEIEHIFIDGKSTDNTLNIISDNCKRDKIIVSESDNGVYDAMNKGMALASGDILCFLNSDDIYFNEFVISKVVDNFCKSNVDYLWGDLLFVDRLDPNRIVRYWKSKLLDRDSLFATEVPPHASFFMKRKVFERHSKFNLRYSIASDFDYMKNIILDTVLRPMHVETYFVKMRVGGLSTSNNLVKQNREIFHSLKSTFPEYNIFVFIFFKLKNKLAQFLLSKVRERLVK